MRENLYHSGAGYIIFGIWSLMKMFIVATMQENDLAAYLRSTDISDEERQITVIVTVVFAVVATLFTIGCHLWIGSGAIRYARGKSSKKTYVILSVIGIVLSLAAAPLYFWDYDEARMIPPDDTSIASILVDITVVFVFFDMIISTSRIDKLNRSIGSDDRSADSDDPGGTQE